MIVPSIAIEFPVVGGELERKRRRNWRANWLTSPEDRAALVFLLRSVAAETVVEIGVSYGYTARCMLDNVASIKSYIGIDVAPTYQPTAERYKAYIPTKPGEMAIGDPRLMLIVRDKGSLDITPDQLPICDAIFIDGDHGYDVAKHDTALAYSRIRLGGLVIWHDYHEKSVEGVRTYLDEFSRIRPSIRHISKTWIAFDTNDQAYPAKADHSQA